jgi:hypothetical protein
MFNKKQITTNKKENRLDKLFSNLNLSRKSIKVQTNIITFQNVDLYNSHKRMNKITNISMLNWFRWLKKNVGDHNKKLDDIKGTIGFYLF